MNRTLARRKRLTLQRNVGPTMCTGWRFICAHCGNVFDRFEAAHRAGDHQLAEQLEAEVLEQARTLGRRR